MTITIDAAGNPWMEPHHIDGKTIAQELAAGATLDSVLNKYSIGATEWPPFSAAIAQAWRASIPIKPDFVAMNEVNVKLAPFALACPGYLTGGEVDELKKLVNAPVIDEKACKRILFQAAIQPDIRAVQLVGRFLKIPLFQEFAYIIDSAAFAFYRGNITAALLTAVPVIEGLLLRWQGYPTTLTVKPKFKETVDFFKTLHIRQPVPGIPHFFDSCHKAAIKIIEDHLFKNTTQGSSHEDFNRHLILHLLEDRPFSTSDNAQRIFLLIDLLSDVYIYEQRMDDPRFYTEEPQRIKYRNAYIAAAMSSMQPGHPEHLLYETHHPYSSVS